MTKLPDEILIDKIMKDIDEDYYSANEMRELLTKNLMKFECLRTKYNELVDTVNHQQAHPHQLLSGK